MLKPRGSHEKNVHVGPKNTTLKGFDCSHYQGYIQWPELLGKVSFVFCKATQGVHSTDPTFKLNWIEAKGLKLLRGAYHYFHPDQDALKQANHFLQTISTDKGELPPVLDLEGRGTKSVEHEINAVLTWLQEVKAGTGRTPIIYSSPSMLNSLGNPEHFYDYPLWIANYGAQMPSIPPPWHTWDFWQYSDQGKLIGIRGDVDLDYFNGTLEEIQSLK